MSLVDKVETKTYCNEKKKVVEQALHILQCLHLLKGPLQHDAFLQDSFHEFYKTAGVLDATFITVIIQPRSCQACSLKAFDMNDRDLVFFDRSVLETNTSLLCLQRRKKSSSRFFFRLLSQWTTGNRYIGIVPTKNITPQIINRGNIFVSSLMASNVAI